MVTRRGVAGFLTVAVLAAATAGRARAASSPQRIVSTAPSITEMLYALGLGNRVVGVTRFDHYPPQVKSKPKIGDYTSPNIEAIAALRPDLVIIQTNPIHLAERLEAMHLRALEVQQENLAELYNSFRVVGEATGAKAQAARLAASIKSKLDQIHQRAAVFPKSRVMFVVGRAPGRLDGLVVAGRASYLNDIMTLAGGDNVFQDARGSYPAVSLEEVLARDPQVIIDMGDMSDTVDVSPAHKREVVALWQHLSSLAAVKQHHVYAVASDIFVVPGPRVVDAAQAFLDMLHPELQARGAK
jgi:iron complex transport system substrate-binding protein